MCGISTDWLLKVPNASLVGLCPLLKMHILRWVAFSVSVTFLVWTNNYAFMHFNTTLSFCVNVRPVDSSCVVPRIRWTCDFSFVNAEPS